MNAINPMTVVQKRTDEAVELANEWVEVHSNLTKTEVILAFTNAIAVGHALNELFGGNRILADQFGVPWNEFMAAYKAAKSVQGRSGWDDLEASLYQYETAHSVLAEKVIRTQYENSENQRRTRLSSVR